MNFGLNGILPSLEDFSCPANIKRNKCEKIGCDKQKLCE
jgi:hypothetical protein